MARLGYVVGGLLLLLVAAPFFVIGGFGAGIGAALSGSSTSAATAICCLGLVAGVAGIIMFIAGLVMKNPEEVALMRAQADYLRRQPPYPPSPPRP